MVRLQVFANSYGEKGQATNHSKPMGSSEHPDSSAPILFVSGMFWDAGALDPHPYDHNYSAGAKRTMKHQYIDLVGGFKHFCFHLVFGMVG